MSLEPIRMLVVDDEDAFRIGLCERLQRKGMVTYGAASGAEAISIARQHLLDVAIVDIRMPGMDGIELLGHLKEAHPTIEVIILTGVAAVPSAIEAMKLGAYDYVGKPCRFDELTMLIGRAHERKRLREQKALLEHEVKRLTFTDEFVGGSEKTLEIRRFIKLAAQADCPVLLEGESGAGKELISREIHRQSVRANAPFVVLDCGAYPETLLADQLFGHERGAFTTAVESRQGLLEMADGGTFLIDEVGEMTPANQVALLRVVETGSFRRLGGSKELTVDVRIIAATNRRLQESVAGREFREDLFYRLEVLRFEVPPLRERLEDVPLLAEHFLALLNRARGTQKRINNEQIELLKEHHWPGNVRELANVIERGYYLSAVGEIDLSSFTGYAVPAQRQAPPLDPAHAEETLADVERKHVQHVLAASKGNKKEAARILGISRSRLYNLLKKYESPASPDAQ